MSISLAVVLRWLVCLFSVRLQHISMNSDVNITNCYFLKYRTLFLYCSFQRAISLWIPFLILFCRHFATTQRIILKLAFFKWLSNLHWTLLLFCSFSSVVFNCIIKWWGRGCGNLLVTESLRNGKVGPCCKNQLVGLCHSQFSHFMLHTAEMSLDK
jgi:hypothetical protein